MSFESDLEEDVAKLRAALKRQTFRERNLRLKLAAVTLAVATGGLFISAGFILTADFNVRDGATRAENDPLAAGLTSEIAEIRREVNDVKTSVKSAPAPTSEAAIARDVLKLADGVAKLDARLTAVESAILESPEKSLSVPMLRKDISDASQRVDDVRTNTKADIDRLYEQQKWMLAGIGAVLLAVAGAAVTIILKSLPGSRAADEA